MARRQEFGSIVAVIAPRAGGAPGWRAEVLASAFEVRVHLVTEADQLRGLMRFWRAQRAAPCSGAIMAALGWLQAQLEDFE